MRIAAELILALSICMAIAQEPRYARLHGHVLDENNTPISTAEISVHYESRDLITFSDPAGAFTLLVPQAGDYPVRVTSPGYFELRDPHIHLNPGVNEISLVLNRVREVTESVKVSAVSPDVDIMDKATAERRLDNTELFEIPFRDNTFQNAMPTLPGVIADPSGAVHVNGGAQNQAHYTLDGFDIADPIVGGFQSRLSLEAVQSMTIASGAIPAEFGKGTAGVVSVNTKMGDDRFRYTATNFLPGFEYRKEPILGSWTPRLGVSGPLDSGKTWFSNNFAGQYAKDVVSDLPSGQDESTNWRYSDMFRAQSNLTPSNILFAGFLVNQASAVRSGLGALDPAPTTTDQRSHQLFFDVKDQLYLGRGSLLEYGFASNRVYGRQIPQGHEDYILTPFGRSGNYFLDGTQRATRDQFLTNYFLPSFNWLGQHQIKTGIDLDRLSYWQDMRRTGLMYYSLNNLLVRQVSFNGNGRVKQANFEASAYIEDSWRVRPHLLLELGLREDWDQILHNANIGPRVGFAWAPFGLRRTKVSGGYGILYDSANLGLFARTSDQEATSTLYSPGSAPFYSISSFLIGKHHLETPRSQNFSLSIEEQFPAGYFATVRAMSRRGSHGLSYFETTPLSPSMIYNLLDTRRDSYDAVEFTIRHNINKRYQWLASYTRSRAISNAVLDISLEQPLIVPDNDGRLPWDAPNRFLSWGFLPTGLKNWSLMYLFDWRSGFPYAVRNEQGQVIGGVSASRFPDFAELDLHIERQFEYRGQLWAWRMGVNNVGGRRNPDVVNNDVNSPDFGQFFGGKRQTYNVRIRWLGRAIEGHN